MNDERPWFDLIINDKADIESLIVTLLVSFNISLSIHELSYS